MITFGIILIIVSVIIIIIGLLLFDEFIIPAILCVISGIFFGFVGIDSINIYTTYLENKCKPKVYKIDLPEEISLVKTNDTLYINKITKDSIYLGFKPNKQ